MFFRTVVLAAATAVGLSAAPSSAATYNAYSFHQSNNGKANHSLRFGKRLGVKTNRLRGTPRGGNKRFRFDKSGGGSLGFFEVSGDTAKLTGTLVNNAGQRYSVEVNFALRSDPGVYKKKKGASRADWSYYTITSGTLTSLTEGLASFDLFQRGRKKIATQFGTGANVSNIDLLGLFSQFRAKEQGCDLKSKSCQRFNGNLRLSLRYRQSASLYIYYEIPPNYQWEEGNPAVVPLPASLAMLPAALGLLGAAGGIARRRRKS